jgi:hypothetical protein
MGYLMDLLALEYPATAIGGRRTLGILVAREMKLSANQLAGSLDGPQIIVISR